MGDPKTTKPQTFSELMDATLQKKCVEPEQRMVGGFYKHAIHRFPIKGGITLRDLMCLSVTKNNSLLRLLTERTTESKVEAD